VKLTKHNVEQMARGYLMYELARRGYCVQITDSRFPTYDMLVVSPTGKHFGIEVKGQSTKNFWRFNERKPQPEMYYAFVFVPEKGVPRVSIMDSATTMRLWREYKAKAIAKGVKEDSIWGLNWTQPRPFENQYGSLPQ
jgi:hypothetical protein